MKNGLLLNVVKFSYNINSRLKWYRYYIDKNKSYKNKFYLFFKMFIFING